MFRGVVLVVERYRLERQDRFAGFLHRFNLFLESPGRTHRAKLAGVRHDDWRRSAADRRRAKDIADPGRCCSRSAQNGRYERTLSAVVTAVPADAPKAVVAGPGCVVSECLKTSGRVEVAAGIVPERICTVSCVPGHRWCC